IASENSSPTSSKRRTPSHNDCSVRWGSPSNWATTPRTRATTAAAPPRGGACGGRDRRRPAVGGTAARLLGDWQELLQLFSPTTEEQRHDPRDGDERLGPRIRCGGDERERFL